MTELKPCPFCGSSDVGLLDPDDQFHCRVCGAASGCPEDESRESKVDRWNTRVSPWRSLKDDPPINAPVLIRRGQRASWRFGAQIMPWLPVSEYYFERGYTEWMEVPE